MVLFCQMDVTGRTEADPAAETLARNLAALRLRAGSRPPDRQALYVGDPAGKAHLEISGIAAAALRGRDARRPTRCWSWARRRQTTGGRAPPVADWLKAGGHLLALGLDEPEANAFLPFKVSMKKAEHIAAVLRARRRGLAAGRRRPGRRPQPRPRELPLVSPGRSRGRRRRAGQGGDANVVFCQLPPYTLNRADGAVALFRRRWRRRRGRQAEALLTLGITGRVQFRPEIKAEQRRSARPTPSPPSLKAVGGPIRPVWRWSGPAARGTGPSRARRPGPGEPVDGVARHLQGATSPSPKAGGVPRWDQEAPGCGSIGCGSTKGITCPRTRRRPAASRGIFSPIPSFENGTKRWRFHFREQQNLRRTYRRTSFLLTRLLANMGVSRADAAAGPLRPRPWEMTGCRPPFRPCAMVISARSPGRTRCPIPVAVLLRPRGATCDLASLGGPQTPLA